jgi:hypothetical protein
MHEIVLYTRPGCHLCSEARTTLAALLAERRAGGDSDGSILERDITTNPDWERAFFADIPVVEIGDRRLNLATSPTRLRRFLDDALAEALSG